MRVGVTSGQSTMNFSRSWSSIQQNHQETRKDSGHISRHRRTSVGSDVNGSSSDRTMNLNFSLTCSMHQAYLEFLSLLTMLIYFVENIFKIKLLDLIILLYKISHNFPFKRKATLRKTKQTAKDGGALREPSGCCARGLPFGPLASLKHGSFR